jgi:hypothetical protein
MQYYHWRDQTTLRQTDALREARALRDLPERLAKTTRYIPP